MKERMQGCKRECGDVRENAGIYERMQGCKRECRDVREGRWLATMITLHSPITFYLFFEKQS